MTPQDAKAWLIEFLPPRDSRIWALGFWASLLTTIATEFADLVPDSWERPLMRTAILLGFLSGKMGWGSGRYRPEQRQTGGARHEADGESGLEYRGYQPLASDRVPRPPQGGTGAVRPTTERANP